jgi:7,8-dihydro-6-hydroxymethylpterin dimethyltransferase
MSGEVLLAVTQSVCPECLRTITAVKLARGDETILRKECPEHGWFQAVIWRGRPDYHSWQRPKTPARPRLPRVDCAAGCPRDCGLCPEHRQHTCTALIEVTRRCDLHCTYCFADGGNDRLSDPDLAEILQSYLQLLRASGPCNIQLSGGEPTLRDDLPEIVSLGRALGFEFIQVNTNGLRLARDPGYAGVLKQAGVASVFLQFDGLEDAVYEKLRGRPLLQEKQRAVEHCVRHGLAVILVPTLVPGVNDRQIGAILDFGLQHSPTVRGVHFQPVSYFGRIPAAPNDEMRITIPEILQEIEAQTQGSIRLENFKPPGCENAYCSFHGNFVLLEDGELLPITRHTPCCTPEAAEVGAQKARRFVSRSWALPPIKEIEPAAGAATPSLGGWDRVLERARAHTFCISGMAFQDAWNLDLERLKDCCIHVARPDGRLIPFCAYNLTDSHGRALYRPAPEAA